MQVLRKILKNASKIIILEKIPTLQKISPGKSRLPLHFQIARKLSILKDISKLHLGGLLQRKDCSHRLADKLRILDMGVETGGICRVAPGFAGCW
jgi:hypothetical protein